MGATRGSPRVSQRNGQATPPLPGPPIPRPGSGPSTSGACLRDGPPPPSPSPRAPPVSFLLATPRNPWHRLARGLVANAQVAASRRLRSPFGARSTGRFSRSAAISGLSPRLRGFARATRRSRRPRYALPRTAFPSHASQPLPTASRLLTTRLSRTRDSREPLPVLGYTYPAGDRGARPQHPGRAREALGPTLTTALPLGRTWGQAPRANPRVVGFGVRTLTCPQGSTAVGKCQLVSPAYKLWSECGSAQ